MATAEVYYKWSNQEDGARHRGGWSRAADANAQGNNGIVALNQHAERQAWAAAWGHIRLHVAVHIAQHAGDTFQVKFWVDQQICPSCQKWMLIDVVSNLKLLPWTHTGLGGVQLFAEVLFAGATQRVRVQRSKIWPVEVGFIARYEDLPDQYT